MGCISSKPAVKQSSAGDGKASAAGVSQQTEQADKDEVQLAPATTAASAAAAAPHAARDECIDEGVALAPLASPPTQRHSEQHEAEAGGPELSGVQAPPVDLDAALRELNGRVQSRCGRVKALLQVVAGADADFRVDSLAHRGGESGVRCTQRAAPSAELLLGLAQVHARVAAHAGSRG